MIYGTEKPKISSSNENNFWWAACPFFVVQIVQNFFTAGFDSGQPNRCKTFSSLIYTNVMIPYLKMISFRKLVHNVFWTGSEYKIMCNVIF